MRMRQSLNDWELAFEHEMALDRRRRVQLRERAEKGGRVRFSVLFTALTATVVVVTVVMFETLALLMG